MSNLQIFVLTWPCKPWVLCYNHQGFRSPPVLLLCELAKWKGRIFVKVKHLYFCFNLHFSSLDFHDLYYWFICILILASKLNFLLWCTVFVTQMLTFWDHSQGSPPGGPALTAVFNLVTSSAGRASLILRKVSWLLYVSLKWPNFLW